MLAKRHGINQKTVAKWKRRTSTADLPTGPKVARSTVLSIEEEAANVARRAKPLHIKSFQFKSRQSLTAEHRAALRDGISMTLDEATARRFVSLTLAHLDRRWPFKLDLILTGPQDLVAPDELHPIFHGSFDWHSCVHGWWQVMRLARRFPDMPEAAVIR